MNVYGINLQKQSGGKILVSVPVDGVNKSLYLETTYNRIADRWSLSIYDGNTQECILSNVPMLLGWVGAQNILRQFGHLGIGSAFIVPLVDNPTSDSPSAETWIDEFELWWGDESA